MASEMNQFMTMQSKLTDGEVEIADQFVRMDSHLKQVDAALQWTRKATAEVDQWIQEYDTHNARVLASQANTVCAGSKVRRNSCRALMLTPLCCR